MILLKTFKEGQGELGIVQKGSTSFHTNIFVKGVCFFISCLQFVRNVMGNFAGDGQKFYPLFYDTVSIVLRNLNRTCSIILGFEAENSVLAYLNGSSTPESSCSKICEFTEKEKIIIKCISEYVMKSLYCDLKNSTEHLSDSSTKDEKFVLVFLKFSLLL